MRVGGFFFCQVPRRYLSAPYITAVRSASGIVLHEAVEMHLASRPTFRQLHRHLPTAAVGRHRQHPLVHLRTPSIEIHLVVVRRAEMLRVALERHRNGASFSNLWCLEAYRCHRADAEGEALVVYRQLSAFQRKTVAVNAHKMVTLRAVHPHSLCVHPDTQNRTQM